MWQLFLSARSEPGKPSILYFRVDDIRTAYDELTARGVSFEAAPQLIHKHDSGVEEWMAFFPDPDGHLLALMSQVPPAG
ncbi:VOC family protein [Kribbella sp. NPDC006257]|uniref:VOC family protein n=1 Tax=Kribbella sp. NPDC006257 TaxID=3156738 RepID=UPI0033AF38E6